MPAAAKTPRLNRRLVMAEYFGCDYADMDDCRYQPTRYIAIPVWTSGNHYYCVTRGSEPPPATNCRGGGRGLL